MKSYKEKMVCHKSHIHGLYNKVDFDDDSASSLETETLINQRNNFS